MSDEDKFKKLERMQKQLEEQLKKYRSGEGEYCAFCGKEKDEVENMWSGPGGGVHICNECVVACYKMLTDER